MAVLVAIALMAAACSDDDADDDDGAEVASETTASEDPVAAAEARVEAAESGVTDSQEALVAAHEQFCVDAESYIEVLDRYGKLFTDDVATVGDVETAGADLVEPRETVATSVRRASRRPRIAVAEAGQELLDAQAALAEAIATASSVPTSVTTPDTTTTTTLVPAATIERVQQAEDELAQAGEGITAATPLAEATAEYNSAAFALQVAWLRLFYDADCFSDEQQAEAVEQVTAYTTTLQTELQQVGYYEGPIDGIYGPATVDAVKRLQADSDLTETGFVDRATAQALDALLADLELQTAAANLTHTASVQTVLTLTGYWSGPDRRRVDRRTHRRPAGLPDRARRRTHRRSSTPPRWPPSNRHSPGKAQRHRTTEPTGAAGHCRRNHTGNDPRRPDPRSRDATVVVADSALGQILTAADGMTVYLFTPDAQSTPTCIDACAEAWPPLTVDDASQVTAGDGVDASLLGTIEHPTGIQVTYNSWPLYLFTGDTAPGDTNGQGQGDAWYVLDPTGNPIDNA